MASGAEKWLAEARGQLGNPEPRARTLLETVTRELLTTQKTEKASVRATVNCRLLLCAVVSAVIATCSLDAKVSNIFGYQHKPRPVTPTCHHKISPAP
jgi:hypothetical protein